MAFPDGHLFKDDLSGLDNLLAAATAWRSPSTGGRFPAMPDVEADTMRITGRARMLDVGNKSFPSITYTARRFPGLAR